ncbi:hypothetical protein SALB1_2740 [Salinisphaera sp. LB1]|nr:hypothetical protein SALB1_2740 [Salinisphaera sp. LB1]
MAGIAISYSVAADTKSRVHGRPERAAESKKAAGESRRLILRFW